ncbi:MAG: DUF3179 domain-containing protein [Phototrophicaceae bacterium]
MKQVRKYSDNIFLASVILGVVVGAGVLYSRWQIVEAYWQTNFNTYSVNPDDIVYGGVARDTRIIPIDAPLFASARISSAEFNPFEPVIVVDYNNIERAYPLTILAMHEIVNDSLGDIPIAVTFCPLCNSAVVYRREVDGQILRMGVSGNFYGNNFLMYDHLTQSWWYQFTGEALVGDLTGKTLTIIPSQVVGFRIYADRYPDGEVLIGDANNPNINYDLTPYNVYQNTRSPALTQSDYDPRLGTMERVLSTTINDVPIAYPFSVLQNVGVINHEMDGEAVVVFWQSGAISALENPSASSNDIGQAAAFGRELNGQILTFRYDDGRIFDNETHSEWNIFGEAIAGELLGEALYDYQCFTHFWFAWSSAHPDTLVYSQ